MGPRERPPADARVGEEPAGRIVSRSADSFASHSWRQSSAGPSGPVIQPRNTSLAACMSFWPWDDALAVVLLGACPR